MKLHILNDLHIESEDFAPPATDADAVVLAGDIGVGLGGLHHAYAQNRYEELTGWQCPAAGGPPAKELTRNNVKPIARPGSPSAGKLGHDGMAVISAYIGR